MLVSGEHYQSIRHDSADMFSIKVIDQRKLPFLFEIIELRSTDDFITAIRDMVVRGAPLIGVTAAYGIYFAAQEMLRNNEPVDKLFRKIDLIRYARPTAVNAGWAVDNQLSVINQCTNLSVLPELLLNNADRMAADDIKCNQEIGKHGLSVIEDLSAQKNGEKINILTHCNAGWLATVDWGTALAPVYLAKREGIDMHIWVDETRPRNQGANLTAWELFNEGIDFTVIPDNTGGHLMQNGLVDMVIVGTDRTTLDGVVYNKIGTYLKALAARQNNIPFYVAAPSSSIDFDGTSDEVIIEQRNSDEIRRIKGQYQNQLIDVQIIPSDYPVSNYAFDATTAELVSGLITERGICKPDRESILKLFPEKASIKNE